MNFRILHRVNSRRSEQGAALATALVFLIVLTLLGLTVMRLSITELKMSSNEQSRFLAREQAQSVVDAILSDNNNLPVRAGTGYSLCYLSATLPPVGESCATNELNLPAGFNEAVYAEVTRLEPELYPVPGGILTSADKFTTALFSVRGRFDRAEDGLGIADLEQGNITLAPKLDRVNN